MQDIPSTYTNKIASNLSQQTTPNISTLTQTGKQALQELLKFGSIDQANKPNIYQTLLTQKLAVNRALSPLDLHAKFDTVRGLVFIQVGEIILDSDAAYSDHSYNDSVMDDESMSDDYHSSDVDTQQKKTNQNTNNEPDSINELMQTADDTWSHPLIRKQRLTLEQSLLLAILRQRYVEAENQHGIGYDNIRIDLDELQSRMQVYIGTSGSDSKDDARLRTLLEQLATHGVVSKIDDNDEVSIRPLIAHLANPENLSRLLQQVIALKDKS